MQATEAGRQRLHRLAGPEVAQLVEALTALAPPRLPERLQPDPPSGPLLRARACYGHVGGQLGAPGESGTVRTFDHPLLTALCISALPDARPGVRSHGTIHLAGALGAALFTAFLDDGWVRRRPGGRALQITGPGRRRFTELGIG
ncbi:hypothetical protein VA596_02215 [Amycolatopsis sp., V23-08]|uniref:ArsR family transcriptional regulator n=1 Tax=Amycolatopsis heterodermiae TaxID=3110235 RepID=A0ABU5QWN9_9PSEU|nr:hypothetical protein [Amycolatopsis sp., V23-08]MEA5358335.1 hypothetical protein [Amycolatopsis sp., V23-08]